MAKQTYKFWSLSPSGKHEKKLLATFTVDGIKVQSDIRHPMIQDQIDIGFYTKHGQITLKENGPAFVELLAANFSTSSFISVEIEED